MCAYAPAAVRRSAEPALVRSGAAIYAGAGAIGTIEAAIPGGTPFSLAPALAAFLIAAPIWLFGARVSRQLLFLLAPIGVALIAQTMATSPGTGDAAIFYAWPVLWAGCLLRHAPDRVDRAGDRGRPRRRAADHVRRHDRPLVRRRDLGRGHRCRRADAGGAQRAARRAADRRVPDRPPDRPAEPPRPRRALRRRGRARDPRAARRWRSSRSTSTTSSASTTRNGHDAGDRALAWLAAVLGEQTRGSDIIARTGGEEFLVVLPGSRPATSASEFAERVRRAVAAERRPARAHDQRRRRRRARPLHVRRAHAGRRHRALRSQARGPRPRRLGGLNERVDEGQLLDHGRREHERVEVALAEAAVDRVERVGEREPGVEQRTEVLRDRRIGVQRSAIGGEHGGPVTVTP